MRDFTQYKGRVQLLRSKGLTYSEINTKLKVKIPKSTLSLWGSTVKMPAWYEKKIKNLSQKNLPKALKAAWIMNKKIQENILLEIERKLVTITKKLRDKNVLKLILSFLYLGEGAKWKSHRGLALGNSNPLVVKLYIKLLSLCYGIKVSNLKARVCYRADQKLLSLQRYWSRITKIPVKHFYSSQPDKRTLGKKTLKKDYKGVCTIICAGTRIQLELEMIPRLVYGGM